MLSFVSEWMKLKILLSNREQKDEYQVISYVEYKEVDLRNCEG